jgi:2,3-bisphosphoglycerate-independent phosphoglycerate mutase
MVIDNVKFLLSYAGGHRVGIVLRGKNLSPNISDGDPHYGKLGKKAKKIMSLDKSKKARFTADVLNKFLEKAHFILREHPLNKKRKKRGLPVANYILVRGAGSLQNIPSFKKRYNLKASCVAGKILYKQIAKILGMRLIDVKGANGLVSTNLKGKFLAAKRALRNSDFLFLHIKATDSLAEDGNFLGKKKFIEKIDKNMKSFLNIKDVLIVVTADHSTCCSLKRHCKEPIPVLIYGAAKDPVKKFSEVDCKKGKLGIFKQTDLMSKILRLVRTHK